MMNNESTSVRFATVVFGATGKLGEVALFHSLSIAGIQAGIPSRVGLHFDSLSELIGKKAMLNANEVPIRFIDGNPITEDDVRLASANRARNEADTASGIADAAAIVFAHSVFEELVHALYELDFEANPTSWDAELEKKQVDFAIAVALTPEELREKMWGKVRHDISREIPLSKNVQALAGRCRKANSSEHDATRGKSKVDLARVEKIDKLRQGLIHRPANAARILETKETLDYLMAAAVMLSELTANCLLSQDVVVDPWGIVSKPSPEQATEEGAAQSSGSGEDTNEGSGGS